MIRYLIRRVLWAVLLFFAVTIVSYILFFIIPADPARQFAGKGASQETIASARHYLGLDKPIYDQYYVFVKRLIVHQDLGHSWYNREGVNRIIKDAAPVTASLVFGGAFFWMLLALPIGIMSALRPRSIDRPGLDDVRPHRDLRASDLDRADLRVVLRVPLTRLSDPHADHRTTPTSSIRRRGNRAGPCNGPTT